MARTAPALTALQRRAAERSYLQLGRRTGQALGVLKRLEKLEHTLTVNS